MADRSAIEWTDATWNPIRAVLPNEDYERDRVGWHCEKVSLGCTNCYAERINKRLGTGERYDHRERVEPFLSESILIAPLRWKKPRRVFVCSMSDLFGEWIPDEWIDQIFVVMQAAKAHTFQLLTKRAKRMREYVTRAAEIGKLHPAPWPISNIWLGVSVEDQERLDERVPELLATPAAVRWVSAEPLLGALNFKGSLVHEATRSVVANVVRSWMRDSQEEKERDLGAAHRAVDRWFDSSADEKRVQWVVVGGESGPGARPMDVQWARDIVRQCREANVAVFVKQLGAKPYDSILAWKMSERRTISTETAEKLGAFYRNGKWSDPAEWPEDLRVREFPEVRT